MTTNTTTRSFDVVLVGNTFPVKEQLKNAGCRWDAQRKCWTARPSIAAKCQAIIDSVSRPQPRASYGYSVGPARRARRAPCGYPGCQAHLGGHCDECA